jgi:hypothetical protein
MKRLARLLLILFSLGWTTPAAAQSGLGCRITLKERSIPGMPGLQSFAWASQGGQWLLVGGRTDGLHRRQAFAAFDTTSANRNLFLVDPATGQVWQAATSSLPTPLREQLSSANFEFLQRDTTLYIIGGYAYAESAGDHITHARLSVLHLPALCAAIRTGMPIAPHIRTLADERLRLTGGQLAYLDGSFLLVGGHTFMGAYNPMGPDFGDGFTQAYSNAIRSFRIGEAGDQLSLEHYHEVIDTLRLHRRDYNLVPQLFPGDSLGYTAFSGVFQYTDRLPWLDAVDVRGPTTFHPVPDFEQLLEQYHCARIAGYDSRSGKMHTLFLGGIGRYYLNAEGGLVDDINVPFVQTISRVTRDPDGKLYEFDTGERMPGFLGAAAEFIPADDVPLIAPLLLDLGALDGPTTVGSIIGGIEAQQDNFFFENEGTQSRASTRIFDVILTPVGPSPRTRSPQTPMTMRGSYDPGRRAVLFDIYLAHQAICGVDIADAQGHPIATKAAECRSGWTTVALPTGTLESGKYVLQLRVGDEGRMATLEIP